jgi:hypothetical protein
MHKLCDKMLVSTITNLYLLEVNVKVNEVLKPSRKELGICTLETDVQVSTLVSTISLVNEVLESNSLPVTMAPI